ncbi:hypothetical protein PYW08_013034 [Mythimna loreyi]|uniref:Uncharacterized protein n=1 Tax=Mythimna loreyi TaxID=667449 RepID=A0ACC2Q0R6_9NEOP|nr:hypothetical protein PYW08_013034 [Mythimna loreyi]
MNTIRSPPQGLSASDSNINRSTTTCLMTSPKSNVTMRASSKRIRLDVDDCNMFDLFKEEMKDMLSNWMKRQDEKMDKLNKGLDKLGVLEEGLSEIKTRLKSSNDEIEKSFGELSAQIKDLDRKIDMLDRERITTQAKLEELEEKSESLDRVIRKTCIEIRGVPKKKKEKKDDLLSMVISLTKSIGSEWSSSYIKDVYRLPSKASATTSTMVIEYSIRFY